MAKIPLSESTPAPIVERHEDGSGECGSNGQAPGHGISVTLLELDHLDEVVLQGELSLLQLYFPEVSSLSSKGNST
ncbi:MAG: hypothetical protein CXR30_02955 [Geobacter sp.]|nr:MAG: hypothetical protein CXR30_02955 [Geobacter sp.]